MATHICWLFKTHLRSVGINVIYFTKFNPRLTKLFFITRLTKGVSCNPSLDFPNRSPYEINFGINR